VEKLRRRGYLPKWLLFTALFVLFIFHNDLWLWHDPTLVMGIPTGLLYHILYCLVASLLFAALVRFAWPSDLEKEDAPIEL